MISPDAADLEGRVLIFAPIGRDAELTRDLLERAAIPCEVHPSISVLAETFEMTGGGALLLTEEALDDGGVPALSALLERQPPWSDVPVLLFAGAPGAEMTVRAFRSTLDVSRIITGKLVLQPSIVDVCDIVARATDAMRPAAVAKSIRITVQEPATCIVRGDPERLQQIFWNLLSNAVKFTPRGGLVRVDIIHDLETITVAVVDSGIGIPPEFAPFVFDRFRQADQATTRVHGGLGLGLSIVKHLAELHGGTVSASSAGQGQGARFEVRLPAADAAAQISPPQTPESNPVSLSGRSILIVDDDESTREVVVAALEAAHADVQAAASAQEAREWLQQNDPALIIADLGMPIEDGFSLIRDVRERLASNVPAIALSAYADQRSREAAFAAGFNEFLAKPTRADALIQLVGTMLKNSTS